MENTTMKKLLNHTLNTLIFSILLMSSMTVFGGEIKWMAVGSLQNWYSDNGCEVELGRTGNIPDQQDGMRYPALYKMQDSQAAKGLWVGAKNYSNPITNTTYDYKVIHMGTRGPINNKLEIFPQTLKMWAREAHPEVFVDGDPASDLVYLDKIDEVDPNLPSDRMIENIVNTSIGVTITRKVYAFTNQYHENYFIHDYVFENTGIYDLEGNVNQQDLEDVMFFYQYRYAISREGGPYGEAGYWLPQNSSWGRNTVNEAIGENPTDNDPFRAVYAWHGLHSQAAYDNIGAPYFGGDGHLGASQFVGVATLHADTDAGNESDDVYQPMTTQFTGSDNNINQNNDQFNASKMQDQYNAMVAGHPAGGTHAEQIGSGFADAFGDDAGGISSALGYGPYSLAFGESIHIVQVEAAAGLSRAQCYVIGANWIDEAIATGDLRLPDGTVPASKDEYKDTWVFTGEDSLMQTFQRATDNYDFDFSASIPPPAPDNFTVTSGGDRITLSWTNNAESWSNFAGYEVYRAIHKTDTTFTKIFTCDLNTITNEFVDKSAKRGFDYYYYIQSYDDGTSNTDDPGVALKSNLFLTLTNKAANLKRPPSDGLDDIRIVPNPYIISGQKYQFGESGPDKLMFYNLPPACKIRIFTERGDLIETIGHTDGSGDEKWNSITQYKQLIVSGIYIAHFELPDGKSTFKKFIIIR